MYDTDLQDAGDNAGPMQQPIGYDPYAAVRDLYQQITGGKYTPSAQELSQFGDPSGWDASYRSKIMGAIGNWWERYQAMQPAPKANDPTPAPGPAPGPGPAPAPGPDQTPPDIYNAPLTKPYDKPFTAPAPIDLGGPPGISFIPKTPTFLGDQAPPTFTAPSVADALNDSGYQFRVGEGMKGIQNAAAARGTLNDSSIFKALSDYNQNAASQGYSNVFDRALNTFATKYGTWRDAILNPTMTAYATQAGAGQSQNGLNYLNAWNAYLNDQNYFSNWQDRVFGKLMTAAGA